MKEKIILKKTENERVFLEKILNKLYKISFITKFDERKTLERIFKLIGKSFNFSRVSYNAYRESYHECIVEWKDKGIKSSLNYKLPDKIVKYFFNKSIKVFYIDKITKNISRKIKDKKTKNLIKDFLSELDIDTLIFIPVNYKDKTLGSITFDICKSQKVKPLYTDAKKRILLKTVKLLSNIIKFYDMQSKLKENERKYREIFQNTNDIVLVNEIKKDGKAGYFIEANKKAIELLKYNKNELFKKRPQDIVTPAFLVDFPRIGKALATKRYCIYETEILDKYGKNIKVEINTRSFYLENKKVALSIIRDITKRKEAEELLKEYQRLHNILINQIGQIIYDYNVKTGKILWAGAVDKILGTHVEEFNKRVDIKKWEEMIHPDDRKRAVELLEVAFKNRGKYVAEYRFLHKKGYYIYVEDEGIFLTDKNNKVYRMLGVMRNVDDKVKSQILLKESEEKFKTFSEQASYGILINQDNKIKYANKSISDILEVKLEDLYKFKNKDFIDMVHPDEKRMAMIYMGEAAEFKSDKIYNVQIRIVTGNGKIKYIDMNFKQIICEGKKANLITVVDITKQKEIEEKLKMIIKELERANTELEQFAYIASHDLQEPLRMISSYVQLLERRYKNQLDKDADDFIKYIVEGTNRMQQLIKALLDYSRIGRITGGFELINTIEIIKKVIADISYLIKEKNAQIIYDNLPEMWGDKVLIEQVFQNLILNALIFSKKEEPLVIVISARRSKNEITFSVKDNGIGISKEYLDKIFELFKRLHTKDEYPGTGIGLAICKKIIELHNGKIWVESEPAKGSTFYFNIPVKSKIKGDKNE